MDLRQFIFVFLVLTFSSALSAREPAAATAGPQSAETSPLVIAVGSDTFPYQFRDPDNGQAAGLLVDLWKAWSTHTGQPIRFEVAAWGETLQMMRDGRADIHAGLSYNDKRAQILSFADPLIPVHMNLFVHHSLDNVYSMEDLHPYRIGVLAKSNHVPALKSLMPELSLVEYSTREALYEALWRGEVRVFAGLERISMLEPHASQLAREFPHHRKLTYAERALLPAVSLDKQHLLGQIRYGMASITQQQRDEISRRWLGISGPSDGIQVAILPDAPPYMMLDENGEPTGLIVDIWRLWASRAGYDVSFVPLPIPRFLPALKDGTVDVIAAFPVNDRIAGEFAITNSLMSLRAQFYVTNAGIEDASDLNGKKVGVFPTSTYLPLLRSQYPELELIFFNTPQEMIEAAQKGEISALLATTTIVEHLLIQRNLSGEFQRLPEPIFSIDVVSVLAPDNQNLKARIERGFQLIEQKALIELENRWILSPQQRFFERQPISVSLTPQEKVWVQQQGRIRFGAVRNYPPFEFVDSDGVFSGIHADLADWLTQRTGLSFEFVLFDSWQQALDAIRARDIDILASVSITDEREEYLTFTRDYWPSPWAVALHDNALPISRLEQIDDHLMAVVQGYEIIDTLRQQYPNIRLREFPDTDSALTALHRGEVQSYLNNLTTLVAQLQRTGQPNIKLATLHDIDPTLSHIAVRSDYLELTAILDKAVALLGENERRRIMFKWLDFEVDQGISFDQIWRAGWKIAAVVATLMLLVLFWNRKLKREVDLRRRVEQQMQFMATHDELTGLPNRRLLKDRLQQALDIHARSKKLLTVMFIDLDGFKQINDKFGHEAGDKLLQHVVKRIASNVRRSDTLARFGGDEFVLLATNLEHRLQAVDLARKLIGCLEAPFEVNGDLVQVSASIGVSISPLDAKTAAEMLRIADHRMYQVKEQGKQDFLLNSPAGSQEMTLDPR